VVAPGVDAHGRLTKLYDRDLKRVLVTQKVSVPKTQLAVLIAAPTAHVPSHEQGACMMFSGADRYEPGVLAAGFTSVRDSVIRVIALFIQIGLAVSAKRLLTRAFSTHAAACGTAAQVDAVGTTFLHEVGIAEGVSRLFSLTTLKNLRANSREAVTTLPVITFSENDPLALVTIEGALVVRAPAGQSSPSAARLSVHGNDGVAHIRAVEGGDLVIAFGDIAPGSVSTRARAASRCRCTACPLG